MTVLPNEQQAAHQRLDNLHLKLSTETQATLISLQNGNKSLPSSGQQCNDNYTAISQKKCTNKKE